MRSKPYVDFYKVLGLATNASAEDIKQSYRNLAKQFHPDRNPSPEAHKQFVEINEAYETLSDPMKRNRYDYFWRYWEESKQRRAANQGSASYSRSPHHQTTNTT